MPSRHVKIALVGCGTVGTGVAKILLHDAELLRTKTGVQFELAHVVVAHADKPRDVELPPGVLTDDLERVLNDREVSIVVEQVGGTTDAREIVKRCLRAGKDVVTANKALLALHGKEIFQTARQHDRCVAFEASCAGGVPVVGAIRDGLVANRITRIYGILNGTCNYILTCMAEQGKTYEQALAEAQAAGYAEKDPSLDVSGVDTAHKLAILATLAFAAEIPFEQIYVEGIEQISVADLRNAAELGYVVKLLAIGEFGDDGISLRVHPAFVPADAPLAWVRGPFNAVSVYGHAAGHTLYYGRGAGQMPTASAVVSDIVSVTLGSAQRAFSQLRLVADRSPTGRAKPIDEIVTRYYLRVPAVDRPGVMAKISKVLGENEINLSAIVQHESREGESVPVLITTHLAREGNVRKALHTIGKLDVVTDAPVAIRLVEPPQE